MTPAAGNVRLQPVKRGFSERVIAISERKPPRLRSPVSPLPPDFAFNMRISTGC